MLTGLQEDIAVPVEVSGTKSPRTMAAEPGDWDVASPKTEMSGKEKKEKKEKKTKKKKAKATGFSEFVEVPPPPPDAEPAPSTKLESTIGGRFGASSVIPYWEDAHDLEMDCGRRLEHLAFKGNWRTCLNCRKLAQHFSRGLMEAES